MAIETDADRLQLLEALGDGTTEVATINAASVQGLLRNKYSEPQFDGVGVESNSPMFICRTSDVSGAVPGDSVTINAVVYVAVAVMPDGTGMTEFKLREST